jgi:hypothetical protein
MDASTLFRCGRLQKIRTVELDGKVIKLQIVSMVGWLRTWLCTK